VEKASIRKVQWAHVRDRIKKVNPNLASIIDDIDPSTQFPLYLARYPYGSVIVNEGVFNIPTASGDIMPMEESHVDAEIKEHFNYAGSGLPAGIVLDRTMHESITTSNHILPLGVVSPGSIFALWKKLDPAISFHPIKMFTLTAGARFIFMLPNISDFALHRNLKRDFNVRHAPPKTLLDQWEIFISILSHPSAEVDWSTELLLFSGEWFEKMRHDSAWRNLYFHLLEQAWKRSAYERNQMFYDLAFSRAQENRNLKPNPYLADTVKHLLMIASGTVAGFGVVNEECYGPINFLQKVYIESYGLRSYVPTFMAPKHFSSSEFCNPVYYSLTLPTTLEFSPKSRKISSTLQDLAELRHVTHVFMEEIRNGKLKVEDTTIGQIARDVAFDFFHSKPDRHGEIQLTQEMVEGDSDLRQSHQKFGKRKFADSGTFIRGCVRISHKNSS
jgi:hypothetical protein